MSDSGRTVRFDNEIVITDGTRGNSVQIPTFDGDTPVNYIDIRESMALALYCEGVTGEAITTAIQTVDAAVVQNETELLWESQVE